ncbi:chemotaxis protein CheC [Fictibacillus iocasae]|uniref:Chemotaxis protein CheC n=1 Tax=Fictibacillus iocasae TaxID=2715437 RepID=A0ABW2NSA0_9BACL
MIGPFSNITPFHLDILKEIGNIGAGHAATALSSLLNKGVDMKVPAVKVVAFDEITELIGGPEAIVASVFLRVNGEAPGAMFFMMPVNQAAYLVQSLMGEDDEIHDEFSEMAFSALQETGNILAGSYLSSLSDFTGMKLAPSVPATTVDMAGAVLSFGLMEISAVSDSAIVIETAFTGMNDEHGESLKGQFFLLPDPGSYRKIFHALGVSIDE